MNLIAGALAIVIVVGLLGYIYVFPPIAAIKAYKKGRRGWGNATLICWLFSIGWIPGTIAWFQPPMQGLAARSGAGDDPKIQGSDPQREPYPKLVKDLAALVAIAAPLVSPAFLIIIVTQPYSFLEFGSLELLLVFWALGLVAAVEILWFMFRLIGRRAFRVLLVPIVILPGLWGSATLVTTSGTHDQIRAAAVHFAPACTQGAPVVDAARWDSGAATIIVLDDSGNLGDWTTNALQLGLSSLETSKIQLVVCLGQESPPSSRYCHYTQGGLVTDVIHSRDVRIVNARMGKTVETKTFDTSDAGCPSSIDQDQTFEYHVNWDNPQIWRQIDSWHSGVPATP